MRKIMIVLTTLAALFGLTACFDTDADVASRNLSTASEQFEISRRITVINGITDKVLMVVEGKCSLEYPDNRTEIVCKLKDGTVIKNVLRQSDNVTLMMEQIGRAHV